MADLNSKKPNKNDANRKRVGSDLSSTSETDISLNVSPVTNPKKGNQRERDGKQGPK